MEKLQRERRQRIMSPTKIYLNCVDNEVTLNKKNYLLRADERLGLNIFEEWTIKDPVQDYILNIQPSDIIHGTKWTGLWHIDILLDSDYQLKYPEVDTVFLASDQGIIPYPKGDVLFQACDSELHRLEHVDPTKKVFIMNEIYRVLKPGGIMEHWIPNAGSRNDFASPSHLSHWNTRTFEYFEHGNRRFENDKKWNGFKGEGFAFILNQEVNVQDGVAQGIHIIMHKV